MTVAACHATCDRPQSRKIESDAAHPRWTLAVSILASSLAFIDSSVMNVALPALRGALGGAPSDLQWAMNSYLLPLSALLLIGGAAGDAFGRRRFLVAGIAIFAVASIGCALAPSYAVLNPMRAVQGLGAAMLMPNSLGLLSHAFPPHRRGRAIGTWAAFGVIASAAGPPLGGWLIGVFGWRAIFLINVPVAAAAIVIALRFVDEVADSNERLDWAGAALATAALALFAWPVTLWSSTQVMHATGWLELAAAALCTAALLRHEGRLGARAMMPLDMFASRAFVGLTLITFLIYTALGGLFLLLPYVLIEGGYSPLEAGVALLPFPVIVGAASRLMGHVADRFGPRWPLAGGSLVGALGYALLTRADPSGSYWLTVVPGAAVLAFGMAGAVAPLTAAVVGAVGPRHTGTAAGFNSAVSRTGGLIAVALVGAVLVHHGPALVASFHAAVWVGAAMALVSALAAWTLLGPAGAPPEAAPVPAPRLT